MTGIFGIIDLKPKHPSAQSHLEQIQHRLIQRKPGSNAINNYALYSSVNRKIHIFYLNQNKQQPTSNEIQTIWCAIDGRIYNNQDLKASLINLGHTFKTKDDSEVLVHAYEEWGLACPDKLEGAFSFGLCDVEKGRVFAARDRFGEKPLFYALKNGVFYFASELSELIAALPEKPGIDPVGLDCYLSYLHILPPHTIYQGVRQLSPAEYLIVDYVGVKIEQYWHLSFANQINQSPSKILPELRNRIRKSVALRLDHEVSWGALLSGGIDSAVVVATLRELTDKEIKTFTIGTDDPEMDEAHRACLVSQKFNTNHHLFYVKPDTAEVLPHLVYQYGQPFADSSAIPTYYVSRMASEHVDVVFSGDAGDHMFGGYRYHYAWFLEKVKTLPHLLQLPITWAAALTKPVTPAWFSNRLNNFNRNMQLDEAHAFSTSYSMGFLRERNRLYKPKFLSDLEDFNAIQQYTDLYEHGDGKQLLDRWMAADIATMLTGDVLTKVAVASSACSLEMSAPFLDRALAEFCATIPAKTKMPWGKQKALIRAAYQKILPNETLNHQKTGFSIPVNHWLRNDLVIFVDKLVLNGKSEILDTFMNAAVIEEIVNDHRAGVNSQGSQVWALLNLVLWEKIFRKPTEFSPEMKLGDLL